METRVKKNEQITTLIFSYNSEEDIRECISAACDLTKNIIVIDMESTDKTREIALSLGAIVKVFPHVDYVEPAREFGISQVKTDWVFILDADERMTPALAAEIKNNVVSKEYTHYRVPRKNIFARRQWLKHGGWWPDPQVRLIDATAFKEWPARIHSSIKIVGKQGRLTNPFLHYFHGDIGQMVQKTILYEDIESELLLTAQKSVGTATFFRKFVGELYRRLLKKMGFLDGKIGIIENIYQAYSKTITYLLLYEKKNRRSL